MNNINDIKDITAEAGIIATLVHNPDFIFHSDSLTPNDFFDRQNGLIYYAISELAKENVKEIDAYNITMILSKNGVKGSETKELTVESLNTLIEISGSICRNSIKEYMVLVENVIDKSFRRKMFDALRTSESMIFDKDIESIETAIPATINKVTDDFIGISKIQTFGEKVDELWECITNGTKGLPSKFPKLNEYLTYEKTELILGCAARKEGKSIFALNEIVDKLKLGYKVVHIDSEMCDRQNLERMLSHLTGITVRAIKSGNYTQEDSEKIKNALEWIKSVNYVHEYMPSYNMQKIYGMIKKMKLNNNVDFVVYDYIKSQGSSAASEVYNLMGECCDFLKNKIAGELDLPVLALAQLNRGGNIADSYKLEQFSSSVIILKRKSNEEIIRDGASCGNYKIFIKCNRLGDQMSDIDTDYIDLNFTGRTITFEQAEMQHEIDFDEEPY